MQTSSVKKVGIKTNKLQSVKKSTSVPDAKKSSVSSVRAHIPAMDAAAKATQMSQMPAAAMPRQPRQAAVASRQSIKTKIANGDVRIGDGGSDEDDDVDERALRKQTAVSDSDVEMLDVNDVLQGGNDIAAAGSDVEIFDSDLEEEATEQQAQVVAGAAVATQQTALVPATQYPSNDGDAGGPEATLDIAAPRIHKVWWRNFSRPEFHRLARRGPFYVTPSSTLLFLYHGFFTEHQDMKKYDFEDVESLADYEDKDLIKHPYVGRMYKDMLSDIEGINSDSLGKSLDDAGRAQTFIHLQWLKKEIPSFFPKPGKDGKTKERTVWMACAATQCIVLLAENYKKGCGKMKREGKLAGIAVKLHNYLEQVTALHGCFESIEITSQMPAGLFAFDYIAGRCKYFM